MAGPGGRRERAYCRATVLPASGARVDVHHAAGGHDVPQGGGGLFQGFGDHHVRFGDQRVHARCGAVAAPSHPTHRPAPQARRMSDIPHRPQAHQRQAVWRGVNQRQGRS